MSPSFQDLKARLDPASSYVIFEKPVAAHAPLEFAAVAELLRPYEGVLVSREMHYDGAAARLFFIVELAQQGAQQVQEALLQARLPRDIVMYLYAKESIDSDHR